MILKPKITISTQSSVLNVIYHPVYSMNNFVTSKSMLPEDGAQLIPYIVWLTIMWPSRKYVTMYDVTS